MMETYTTVQGDTWDRIAWLLYQDHGCMRYLLQANPEYIEELVFSDGVVLRVPEIPQTADERVPFWRR